MQRQYQNYCYIGGLHKNFSKLRSSCHDKLLHWCCYESGMFYGKGIGLGSQTRLGWSPALPLTSCVILRSHLASLIFNSLICKSMVVGRKGNCSVNSAALFKRSAFVKTQWKMSLVGSSVFFHCCGKLVHRIRKFTDSSWDVLKLVITSEMGWVLIVSVPGKPINETCALMKCWQSVYTEAAVIL